MTDIASKIGTWTLEDLFRRGADVSPAQDLVDASGKPRAYLFTTIDLSTIPDGDAGGGSSQGVHAAAADGANGDGLHGRRAAAGAAEDANAGSDFDDSDDDMRQDWTGEGRHGASDEDCPSDPEELADRTAELETRLKRARSKFGPEDERTLRVLFLLLDAHVAQYHLNRMDELFAEYFEVCRKVRGKWWLKAIQSRAFCAFKQYKFKDALELFKEQEKLLGASAPLCENIGHVCSSLGRYEEAEKYFTTATQLLPPGRVHSKNSGGVYLGLGLLRDRLGRTREALPVLEKALELYTDACWLSGAYVETSLVAKAHMSLGHAHEHLGELGEAEKHMREAVAVFERTVGEDSPLLAGALGALGKVRVAQREHGDAVKHLKRALGIEVRKDAFHARTVWELVEEVKTTHDTLLKHGPAFNQVDVKAAYSPYVPLVRAAGERVRALGLAAKEADTISVLYKACGEVMLLGGADEDALVALNVRRRGDARRGAARRAAPALTAPPPPPRTPRCAHPPTPAGGDQALPRHHRDGLLVPHQGVRAPHRHRRRAAPGRTATGRGVAAAGPTARLAVSWTKTQAAAPRVRLVCDHRRWARDACTQSRGGAGPCCSFRPFPTPAKPTGWRARRAASSPVLHRRLPRHCRPGARSRLRSMRARNDGCPRHVGPRAAVRDANRGPSQGQGPEPDPNSDGDARHCACGGRRRLEARLVRVIMPVAVDYDDTSN